MLVTPTPSIDGKSIIGRSYNACQKLVPAGGGRHNSSMAALETHEQLPQSLPRASAALLISLTLHLTACLVGVISWLQQPLPTRGLGEVARRVEVALARTTSDKTDYFKDSSSITGSEPEPNSEAIPSDDPLPSAESLPNSASPLPTLADQPGAAQATNEGVFVL